MVTCKNLVIQCYYLSPRLLPVCVIVASLSVPRVINSLSPKVTPSATSAPVTVAPVDVVSNFQN